MDSEGAEWMQDCKMLQDDCDEHHWGRIVRDDSWDHGDVTNAIFGHADSHGNQISTPGGYPEGGDARENYFPHLIILPELFNARKCPGEAQGCRAMGDQ